MRLFAISIFAQNSPQIRITCKYKKRHHLCIKLAMRGIAVFAIRHMVQSRSQIYNFAYVQMWWKMCDFKIRIKFAHTFAHTQI
jgi:hypothetical protein